MRTVGVALALLIVSCGASAGAQNTPWPTQTYGEISVTLVRPGTTPGASPTVPVGTEVRILGSTFDPQILEVPRGSLVTWTSRDSILHTVTSGTFGRPDGLFDRELLGGGTFAFTFIQPGRVAYYCRFHAGMQGTLIVR